MRMARNGELTESGKLAYLSESDETRSDFDKEADLLETLAGLDAELTLIDLPARNAEVVILSRTEATFRLKSNMIRHIVSKPGAERGFS